MFSFEFANQLKKHINVYRHFALPAVLCDLDFHVFWSNPLAQTQFPQMTKRDSILHLVGELDPNEILRALAEKGNYQIGDVFPFTNILCSFSPLYTNDDFIGMVAIFMEGSQTLSIPDAVTKSSSTLDHQIRNSLHNFFNSCDKVAVKADLLEAHWLNPHLNEMSLSAYEVLRTSNNISSYTQILNEHLFFQREALSLNQWLQGVHPGIHEFAQLNQIPMFLNLPDQELLVSVDYKWFQLAFYNLLHNSLYYTKPGNEISLSIEEKEDSVLLIIQDRGLGIPEEILPYVTRPYFSYGYKDMPPGIGIGLALVTRIAKEMRGDFFLASSPQGTTATLELPKPDSSQPLHLRQHETDLGLHNRFSPLYIGLTSIISSPYHTMKGFQKER